MIKKLLSNVLSQRHANREAELYRSLIRREAQIGGALFGPVPTGRRREFFCLDEHTWVWHEEWHENGQLKNSMTRYDVRPDGILKSQHGKYQSVSEQEARHLRDAARLYQQKIRSELYNFVA
jgi:hypothetical protein